MQVETSDFLVDLADINRTIRLAAPQPRAMFW
jgi:hypothetical protein